MIVFHPCQARQVKSTTGSQEDFKQAFPQGKTLRREAEKTRKWGFKMEGVDRKNDRCYCQRGVGGGKCHFTLPEREE